MSPFLQNIDTELYEPCTRGDIEGFEKRIGYSLPSWYKTFLLEFGGGYISLELPLDDGPPLDAHGDLPGFRPKTSVIEMFGNTAHCKGQNLLEKYNYFHDAHEVKEWDVPFLYNLYGGVFSLDLDADEILYFDLNEGYLDLYGQSLRRVEFPPEQFFDRLRFSSSGV